VTLDNNDVAAALDELWETGYTRVGLTGSQADDLGRLETVLTTLAEPLHVYRRHPFWKPLVADPDRPAGRSGGTGLNSLHIDCVNTTHPPDLVCIYCVRPDPLGGGRTIVAPLDQVESQLTAQTLRVLQRPVFRDGTVHDLDHVGADANPFPVLAARGWRWRYTGRLLESGSIAANSAEHAALLEFDRVMMSRAIGFTLDAGEALVVDQRRVLHGRFPLGVGQEHVSTDRRRLLVQSYYRGLRND